MRSFVLALILIPFLSGCSDWVSRNPTTSLGHVPSIQEPERPKLEKMTPEELAEYAKLPESVRKKLQDNNDKLQIYSEQLHVSIVEYNGFAKYRNAESTEFAKDGFKKKKKDDK